MESVIVTRSMLSLSTYDAVYTHAHINYISLCLANVQLKSNTSPLHYSRRSPYNSPPPTTLSLPPISRIQHQHTMNVGVEKDREGENLPKIILTHNRVVKRDRNWGLGWICVYQNKMVQGGQTREFPCPSAWFPQTNQETGKALGRFCFRHPPPLMTIVGEWERQI